MGALVSELDVGNGFGVSKGLLAEGGLVTPKSTGLSTGGYVMPGGYNSIIGASVSEGVPTEGGPVSPDETGLLTGEVVGVASVVGTLSGVMAVGLTLIFMALKTGLHAHGPEFTPREINWLIQQLPLWSIIGLLLGIGTSLITGALWQKQEDLS